jgi:hypothetical protein
MEFPKRITSMPVVLRILCLASFFLGVFQIIGLIFPEIAPKMKGEQISSTVLMVLFGFIHISLGLSIFFRKKWSMFLVIIFPFLQNSIYYLDTNLPTFAQLQIDFVMLLIWATFFSVYFYFYKFKSYFYSDLDV